MDLRIGAKSPVYSARTTSKLSDPALKSSFAKMMAETKPVNQDTVEISGNPLAKRLEGVHQKIDGMDFNGKSSEEVYRSIIDAYEDEFGFIGNVFYLDREGYNEIHQDQQRVIADTVPNFNIAQNNVLYYRAMGYDKMTNEEKVAAITKRVGGNSIIDKYSVMNEMVRANVLTSHQRNVMWDSLTRKTKMEYCEQHGFDYQIWECFPERYYGNSFEKAVAMRNKSITEWVAKTDITWLEIIESVKDYPAMWDFEKDSFFKEMEGITGLLIGSDKV